MISLDSQNLSTLPRIDFFYSDPHYYHGKIIGYQNRPFFRRFDKDSKAMNEELIARYNSVVQEDSFVLWLGDAFFHVSRNWMRNLLASLNGRKGLILGNHDGSRTKMLDVGFEFVQREAWITLEERKIHLHHYPYYTNAKGETGRRNPKPYPGEILIHGHTHSIQRVNGRMINVCVEAWDYTPVAVQVISELIKTIPEEE